MQNCDPGLFPLSLSMRRRVACWLAAPLFWFSLIYLVAIATLIVLWADVPRVANATAQFVPPEQWDTAVRQLDLAARWILFGLWPVFIAETIFYWCCRPWNSACRRHQLLAGIYAFCPGLRLCPKLPELNGRVWLVGFGWRTVDNRLRDSVERRFSLPMILFALLVMPILLAEQFMKDQLASSGLLRVTLHVGTGLIWLAFTVEFLIKSSISRSKLRYCKENWIDLLIIILPLIAFLRSLRLLRFARLFRVSYLVHLGRAYRLRGLWMKAVRAIVILELADRLFRGSPERRLERLQEQERRLLEELTETRRQIGALEFEREDCAEGSKYA